MERLSELALVRGAKQALNLRSGAKRESTLEPWWSIAMSGVINAGSDGGRSGGAARGKVEMVESNPNPRERELLTKDLNTVPAGTAGGHRSDTNIILILYCLKYQPY